MDNTVRRTEYRQRTAIKNKETKSDGFLIVFLRQLILCAVIFAVVYLASMYNNDFKSVLKSTLDYSIDFKNSAIELMEATKNVFNKIH